MVLTDLITLTLMAWLALVIRNEGFVNIYETYEITGASSDDIIHFLLVAPSNHCININWFKIVQIDCAIYKYQNICIYCKSMHFINVSDLFLYNLY